MAHLISPIDIDGTLYCIKQGATTPKWRTLSIFDSPLALTGAEDEDSWESEYSQSGNLFLRFATCCVWKVTFRFEITSGSPVVHYSLSINGGTNIFSVNPPSVGAYFHTVDLNDLGLMGRACGNLWVISCIFNGNVSVTDVVFGPPI